MNLTRVVRSTKQPRGGYLPHTMFEYTQYNDGLTLHSVDEENIAASVVGQAVEYLASYLDLKSKNETNIGERVFQYSLLGAKIRGDIYSRSFVENEKGEIIYTSNKKTKDLDYKEALKMIDNLSQTDTLSNKGIMLVCQLAVLNSWYRSGLSMMTANIDYQTTFPNQTTCENIIVMVQRTLTFFDLIGPIIENGFNYIPREEGDINPFTEKITIADGDFLTKDLLFDLKVYKNHIGKNETLQILLYYLLGKHSSKKMFKKINKIGIFNPRKNESYILEVSKIPKDLILEVEKEVIGYK